MLSTRRRFYTSESVCTNASVHNTLSTPCDRPNFNALSVDDNTLYVDSNVPKRSSNLSLLRRPSQWEEEKNGVSSCIPIVKDCGYALHSHNKKESPAVRYQESVRVLQAPRVPSEEHPYEVPLHTSNNVEVKGLETPVGVLDNERTLVGERVNKAPSQPLYPYSEKRNSTLLSNSRDAAASWNQRLGAGCHTDKLNHTFPPKEQSRIPFSLKCSNQLSVAAGGLSAYDILTEDKRGLHTFVEKRDIEETSMDTVGLKCSIDYCIKQDETSLYLDSYISSVPIGTYTPVSKIFSLNEPLLVSTSSPKCSDDYPFHESSVLPKSFRAAVKHRLDMERTASSAGNKQILEVIPDLNVICYTTPDDTHSCTSATSLYLWKWTSSKPPAQLTFQDPITAIGYVNPMYFFFHQDYTNDSSSNMAQSASVPSKLLLVATTSTMSLWAVRESTHVSSSTVLTVTSTPYSFGSPKARVTSIVGHNESGRLFFGDVNGAVHEFIFTSTDPSGESWMSFFYRMAPWASRAKSSTRTMAENVSAPSLFHRVFGSVLGTKHAIIQLVMDGERGLLYALDDASNIQVFFLPPPDVTSEKHVVEYPLQPIVVLSHSTILSQLRGIHREVLRVLHEQNRINSTNTTPDTLYSEITDAIIRENTVVRILPTKLNEGDSVVALAILSDGSRLYLCARVELPLLPKRFEATSFPNMIIWRSTGPSILKDWFSAPCVSAQGTVHSCHSYFVFSRFLMPYCVGYDPCYITQWCYRYFFFYAVHLGVSSSLLNVWFSVIFSYIKACNFQHIKTLYVANWKPPCTSLLPQTLLGGTSRLPRTSVSFYNQKTFLYAYPQSDGSSVLMCVAFDETSILSRGHAPVEDPSLVGKMLKEWCQCCTLPECEILDIYEEFLPVLYQNMLEGDGPLPSPYDILSRMYREKFLSFTQNQASEAGTDDSMSTASMLHARQKHSRAPKRDSKAVAFAHFNSSLELSSLNAVEKRDLSSLCHKINKHRCIPPTALHNWVATQTVPARMFTLLTSKGIYHLQQNRFYDLLKNTASAYVEQSRLQKSLATEKLGELSQFYCAGLSSQELKYMSSFLLSSGDPQACFYNHQSELNKTGWRQLAPYALLSIHCVCQLMAPEQALALAWQMLTFTAGSVYWKSETTPLTESHRPKVLANPSLSPSPHSATTPFSSALRKNQQKQVSNTSLSLDISMPLSLAGASALSFPTVHQFPLPLMQHALLSWLSHWVIHSKRFFQECSSSSFHGDFISARIKGLLLYISRILRPFWLCPIFETLAGNGILRDYLQTVPALYRVPREDDFYSLHKLEVNNNADTDAGDIKKESNDMLSSRKRPRGVNDGNTYGELKSKRRRSQQGGAIDNTENLPTDQCIFVISTRFNSEEFSKACDWLNLLHSVVERVISLIENENPLGSNVCRENDFHNAKAPLQPFLFDRTDALKPNPFVRSVQPKTDIVTRDPLTSKSDLQIIRCIKKRIQLISQCLSCCSLILTEMKKSNVLPEPVFSILISLSLSDMFVGSPQVQHVYQTLLVRHIIAPHVLLEKCPLLFSQEDLLFHCTIHPLFTLHRIVMSQYQWKWDLLYRDSVQLDKASILRSPGIIKAIDVLLSAAAQPHRRIPINATVMIIILVEFQLFGYLADFIARLCEATLIEYAAKQNTSDQESQFPTEPTGTDTQRAQMGGLVDSSQYYQDDPRFRLCFDAYYSAINILLNKYYAFNRSDNKTMKPQSFLAQNFVTACLALKPECTTDAGSNVPKAFSDVARTWLHYVVLDWINDVGQRTFPVSLENAETPVYASWVNQRKESLGPGSTKILSRFFYNNGYYCQFAEFLLGISSKKWNEPTQVLSDTIDIPNHEVSHSDTYDAGETFQFSSLENYASPSLRNLSLLAPIEPTWSQFVEYLTVVCCGLTLERRYTYLTEARDSLETGLNQFDRSTNLPCTTYIEGRKVPQSKDSLQAIQAMQAKVDRAIDTVSLQVALCRETIEICCFLWLKYRIISKDVFLLAFSKDKTTRTNAAKQLSEQYPNQYQHLHNIQSLFYLLRWKIYDSPLDLLQLIQEFVDASKSLIPYPGLCLLSHPVFAKSNALSTADEPDSTCISRQSIVSAAVFCRGFIAVELQSSGFLCDFPRAVHHARISTTNNETRSLTSRLPLDEERVNETPLLFWGDILLTLHEVAVVFRDKSLNSVLNEPMTLQPVCPDFKWSTHWWTWPSMLIQHQLNDVDNRISWDKERQLEGQQKLPFYQKLVEEYQKMMDAQFYTNEASTPDADQVFGCTSTLFSHLNLSRYHYFIILLDLREVWMRQLLGMASCLAYIHLLATDLAMSYLSTSGSTETDVLENRSLSLPIEKAVPTQVFSSGCSIEKRIRPEIDTSSTRQIHAPQGNLTTEFMHIPTAYENKIKGENQLAMHLRGLYYKSPSRLQFYFERCQDLIKGFEQVLRRQKDWYAFYQPSIEKCLENQYNMEPYQDLGFCLQELRLAEKAFLNTLEKLQQRIPMLQTYQRTIQQVLIQKLI